MKICDLYLCTICTRSAKISVRIKERNKVFFCSNRTLFAYEYVKVMYIKVRGLAFYCILFPVRYDRMQGNVLDQSHIT